ncbi:kinesin-like protein KIN-7O [Nicotiana tomentosiformis]|uniref:kinesin-like protein KIN-7O n=1 Tax=Nicotiana tomentosiformis TaxID=4098 RepID=UPI00388CDD93
MAKISKTVPQKEAASSSGSAGEKIVVEPRLEKLVPGGVFLDAAVAWMSGAVPHLENWVRSLVSTSTYAERAWRDLSKGRWEARTHGLGKDAVMRPPSCDKEALPPISKPEKVINRKRASDSKGQKPKKRVARKPKVNIITLTMESVLSLRDEEEESFCASLRGIFSILRGAEPVRSRSLRLTEERDAFKLLSEQREGEVKGLRADLEASRKEQAELAEQVKRIFEFNDIDSGVMANSSVPQVEKKFNVIRQLRVEVDVVKSEAEEWKKNMDRLASEKETARTQLALAEAQLRSLKEKALVQAKKIEEFQSRLSSANSDRERLATKLAVAKSEVEKTMANADAMVAVYRSDAKAAQVRAKEVTEAAQAQENWVAEHAKCQSRRETLEEIHARGFDLIAEIEKAKELEAETRGLAFPDDDDTGSTSGSLAPRWEPSCLPEKGIDLNLYVVLRIRGITRHKLKK